MTDFFTVKEFSIKLKVPESTIRRAIQQGRIHAFRISSGKKASYRIHEGQIARLMMLDTINKELENEDIDM